ncbi:hypothetical protein AB6809_11530 [Paraburkholderia sp. RCC_158]|uniref:hypothetical protein n=1 Tax=Paraburkholderia sp. RCC_158 TaxID=3239220 RepID=UPI0035256877
MRTAIPLLSEIPFTPASLSALSTVPLAVNFCLRSVDAQPAVSRLDCSPSAEIDPRRPLWERVSEALHAHGYQWPLGPYTDVRQFTLFVERQTAGDAATTPEACIQIVVDREDIHIRIVAAPGATLNSQTLPALRKTNLINLAKRVIAHLR